MLASTSVSNANNNAPTGSIRALRWLIEYDLKLVHQLTWPCARFCASNTTTPSGRVLVDANTAVVREAVWAYLDYSLYVSHLTAQKY